MFKRCLSLSIVVMLVSALGFSSFADTVKKSVSDNEIADAINIVQPASKVVILEDSTTLTTLTISGTAATFQGLTLSMSLDRLDAKALIDSVDSLQFSSIPKSLLETDTKNIKENAIVKKFAKAYAERIKAGFDFDKTSNALDNAKKDSKLAPAKLKGLKEDVDKASKNLKDAIEDYQSAASDYSDINQVSIFSDVTIERKFAGFEKNIKNVPTGYYNLTFKRSDNNHIVKTVVFEVIGSEGIILQKEGNKK